MPPTVDVNPTQCESSPTVAVQQRKHCHDPSTVNGTYKPKSVSLSLCLGAECTSSLCVHSVSRRVHKAQSMSSCCPSTRCQEEEGAHDDVQLVAKPQVDIPRPSYPRRRGLQNRVALNLAIVNKPRLFFESRFKKCPGWENFSVVIIPRLFELSQ